MANKKPLKGKFLQEQRTLSSEMSRLDLIKHTHRRLYIQRVTKGVPPPEHIYREDICFSCGGSFTRDVDEQGFLRFPLCPLCKSL